MLFWILAAASLVWAQGPAAAPREQRDHGQDVQLKAIDDATWYLKLGAVADMDKVRFTSAPPAREANPTAQGAGNAVIVAAYTFLPKKLDRTRKHPFLVYVHGGVHSNFSTSAAHIIRELENGYPMIAPDYRGSTGYGRRYYELIDYGGRENDDVWAARNWMVETHAFLDAARAGILGWSHGGMITLMNVFEHPKDYACAYAGVPVSDLVARMGYKTEAYRRLSGALPETLSGMILLF